MADLCVCHEWEQTLEGSCARTPVPGMIKDSDNLPAKAHQILFGLFTLAIVEGLMEGREVTFSLVHFMDSKAMDRFSPFAAKSIANRHVSRSR